MNNKKAVRKHRFFILRAERGEPDSARFVVFAPMF